MSEPAAEDGVSFGNSPWANILRMAMTTQQVPASRISQPLDHVRSHPFCESGVP